jgi:hypothetical protein
MIQEIHLSPISGVYLLCGQKGSSYNGWSPIGVGQTAFYVGQSRNIAWRFTTHSRPIKPPAKLRCIVLESVLDGADRIRSERRYIAAAQKMGLRLCNGLGSVRSCRRSAVRLDLMKEIAKLREAVRFLST